MAIAVDEFVVHESHDVIVTQSEDGEDLTIWHLIDTRMLEDADIASAEALRKAMRSEISVVERTGVVIEDTGYTKIYRPHISIHVHDNVPETVKRLLKEMQAA